MRMQEVDFTRPTAFVLGNERAGVSETAVAMADHTAIIPMVSTACLRQTRHRPADKAGLLNMCIPEAMINTVALIQRIWLALLIEYYCLLAFPLRCYSKLWVGSMIAAPSVPESTLAPRVSWRGLHIVALTCLLCHMPSMSHA
jgi:hypothetical protein